jgi:hypothetical protein
MVSCLFVRAMALLALAAPDTKERTDNPRRAKYLNGHILAATHRCFPPKFLATSVNADDSWSNMPRLVVAAVVPRPPPPTTTTP